MTGVQTCALPICFPVTITAEKIKSLKALNRHEEALKCEQIIKALESGEDISHLLNAEKKLKTESDNTQSGDIGSSNAQQLTKTMKSDNIDDIGLTNNQFEVEKTESEDINNNTSDKSSGDKKKDLNDDSNNNQKNINDDASGIEINQTEIKQNDVQQKDASLDSNELNDLGNNLNDVNDKDLMGGVE